MSRVRVVQEKTPSVPAVALRPAVQVVCNWCNGESLAVTSDQEGSVSLHNFYPAVVFCTFVGVAAQLDFLPLKLVC